MQPFTAHTGLVCALDRSNVDTDQIIPKQFLKRIERTGYGPFLFFDWRYEDDGQTPRGEFEVQRKIVDPVWTKPDWAFIEDGEPIPKEFSERFDPDVLGDYALAIGDGYLIHGSIYKRTLGQSVTHGCIRVGDADLEAVYKAAQLGTKVYIL